MNYKQNELDSIRNGNDNQLEYDSSLALLYNEIGAGSSERVDVVDHTTTTVNNKLNLGTLVVALWISTTANMIMYSRIRESRTGICGECKSII